MVRYTADWILPIADAPIRRGWVAIEGGRIAAVGPRTRDRRARLGHTRFRVVDRESQQLVEDARPDARLDEQRYGHQRVADISDESGSGRAGLVDRAAGRAG
ncbi:MAG TPA: hypothetical protein VNI78_02580, partial [Vicinamibacterales bacterium]|nr:hypothetical protein [Vicinamibacterales bacterium]